MRFLFLPPHDAQARTWAMQLAAEFPDLEVLVAEDEADVQRMLPEAQAAFGTLLEEWMPYASSLQWLQAPMAAPPAGYFHDGLVAHPVQVTNFRGIYNDHVAIHAMALLLMLVRNIPRYTRQQITRSWERDIDPAAVVHLPEATVAVLGVGGIGAAIARMLEPYGCHVIGVDPRIDVAPPGVHELVRPDNLDATLSRCNIVVMTLPHTPESERMIDARRLALMPRGSVLVNIGRGGTVVLDAVVEALRSGQLRGAGLDVFEEEPLPPEHPLWDCENAVLTPHVAVVGPELDDRRYAVIAENVRHMLSGTKLVNVVDKTLWY